jgi:uncharacterized phage protein (TIGR02218 family)
MTYDAREQSVNAGAPVELYEFTRGATAWRYTSADEDQTYLANTYVASPVTRGKWERLPSASQAGMMEFRAPWNHPLAQEFITGSIHTGMGLKVFVRHRADSEFLLAFWGMVTGATVQGVEAILTARSLEGRLTRRVPRMAISRTCPFMLGDDQCNVDMSAYDFSGTVSAVSMVTNEVTVTGLNTFVAGDLTYFVDGYLTKSGLVVGYIEGQSGDVLRMMERPKGIAVSDTVIAFPGCDRTIGTCSDKFANVTRFGGHHRLPLYNPWAGIIGMKENADGGDPDDTGETT